MRSLEQQAKQLNHEYAATAIVRVERAIDDYSFYLDGAIKDEVRYYVTLL
jgi:hypothetical protein